MVGGPTASDTAAIRIAAIFMALSPVTYILSRPCRRVQFGGSQFGSFWMFFRVQKINPYRWEGACNPIYVAKGGKWTFGRRFNIEKLDLLVRVD